MDSNVQSKIESAVKSKKVEDLLELCTNPSHKEAALKYEDLKGRKLIHYAATFGSLGLLKSLVSLGADLKSTTNDYDGGQNILHIACENGKLDIVDYVLQTVRDTSFRNTLKKDSSGKNYKSAFYYAAKSECENIVRRLKSAELNINELFPNKKTALYTLIIENEYAGAEILCRCGANPSIGIVGRGLQSIHYLAKRKEGNKFLRLILQYGANVNEPWGRKPYAQQPLFVALKQGMEKNVKILLESGANVTFRGKITDKEIGWIGCFCFAAMTCPSLIPDFLRNRADPNEIHEKSGNSVLLIAMDHARKDEIIALIKAGANKGQHGKTAIQCCKSYGQLCLFRKAGISVNTIEVEHKVSTLGLLLNSTKNATSSKITQIATKLLSAGANSNMVPQGEDSPLIIAVRNKMPDVVDILLKHKADVNHLGKNGTTAIHACCENDAKPSDKDVLSSLLEFGADINATNSLGETALLCYIRKSDKTTTPELTEFLLDKGVDPNICEKEGNSVLMEAINRDLYSTVKLLVQHKANINHIREDGITALHLCLLKESPMKQNKRKRSLTMEESLKNVKMSDALRRKIVHRFEFGGSSMASSSDETIEHRKTVSANQNTGINEVDDTTLDLMGIIDFLVLNEANVNLNNEGCDSPLILAVRKHHSEIVRKILNASPNLFHCGKENLNAIETCFSDPILNLATVKEVHNGTFANRRLECLNALVEHTDIGERKIHTFHQLYKFLKRRSSFNAKLVTNICSHLLDSECYNNLNVDKEGEDSPLIYFCKTGIVAIVEMLIGCNVDVNHAGESAATALHHVISLQDQKIAVPMLNCLLTANALLEIRDSYDQTPFEKAVYILCEHTTSWRDKGAKKSVLLCLIQRLLDAGVVADHVKLGNVLLESAELGDFKTMENLICHGANVDNRNYAGQTVVHVCWSNSLDGAMDFLNLYVERGGVMHQTDIYGDLPHVSLLKNCNANTEKDGKIANIVRFLIKNCNKFDDKDCPSLLHTAVKKGLVKTANVILKTGARVNTENRKYETPLYLATTACNRRKLVDLLLRNGADPNHHSSLKIPIISALKLCDVDTVMSLIKKGANVNVTDHYGRSLLHVLFAKESTKGYLCLMTKLLLENNINVNVKDVFGKPAIFMLFQPEELTALCQKPMLHSEEDIKDVVSMLISHGLDVNLFDGFKSSVLDIICSSGRQPNAGIILLNAGADPTRSNCFQKAITTNSAVKNADWVEFIQLLLQKGCDPNVFIGDTSNLIHVTKKGLICIVEKLIKHGANVNFCTSGVRTALHYACELSEGSARDDIVSLLVKSGAKLNIRTSSGESPLYILVNAMINDVKYNKYNKAEGDEAKRVIKKEIDLSSFNRLVCGGAQLKADKITDSTDMESRNSFIWEFPIGDLDEHVTKSALQSLIKNGFLKAAMCLLESGWEFRREKWFENLDLSTIDLSKIKIEGSLVIYKRLEIENAKSKFQTFARNTQSELQSLAQFCRRVIRNSLIETSNGSEIESKIEVLPVPTKIKSFLTLVDNCHDSEIFLLENIQRPRFFNQRQPALLQSSLITSDFLEMDTDDEDTYYFMNDYGSDENYVDAHDDDLLDDEFMF